MLPLRPVFYRIVVFSFVSLVILAALYTWSFNQIILHGRGPRRPLSGFLNEERSMFDNGNNNYSRTLWQPSHWPLTSDPNLDRVEALEEFIQRVSRDEKSLAQLSDKVIFIHDGFDYWKFDGLDKSAPKLCQTKCKFVEDKTLSRHAHAVVLVRDWAHYEAPVIPDATLKVLVSQESPISADFGIHGNNTILASYYRGSHLVLPYGKWIPYKNTTFRRTIVKDYTQGKKRDVTVAAFISNCVTSNNRIKYVEELSKYLDIHVIGACGDKNFCPRTEPLKCFNMLKKDYKFYLALENAHCRDYITEKLFVNAMQNDVVPIVWGAHPDDYAALAPPNSYILANNFTSPRKLAEYVSHLNKNNEAYNEYFKWKGTGHWYEGSGTFCRICALAHYSDIIPPPQISANTSWRSVNKCLKQPSNDFSNFRW